MYWNTHTVWNGSREWYVLCILCAHVTVKKLMTMMRFRSLFFLFSKVFSNPSFNEIKNFAVHLFDWRALWQKKSFIFIKLTTIKVILNWRRISSWKIWLSFDILMLTKFLRRWPSWSSRGLAKWPAGIPFFSNLHFVWCNCLLNVKSEGDLVDYSSNWFFKIFHKSKQFSLSNVELLLLPLKMIAEWAARLIEIDGGPGRVSQSLKRDEGGDEMKKYLALRQRKKSLIPNNTQLFRSGK